MTWFKADDNLQDHPKVLRLGRDMVPAIGVWTLVGTWAARQNTDGFVPVVIIRRYDPRERLAKRLVSVGLFERAEVNGVVGYRFHDWPDHQPTAAEVEKKRALARDRQRRFRERSGQFGSDGPDPSDTDGFEQRSLDQAERTTEVGSNAVTAPSRNGARNALLNALVTTTPSRPDPLVKEEPPPLRGAPPSGRSTKPARGTRIPANFKITPDMIDWARRETPNVPLDATTEDFCDYWNSKPGKEAEKLDWPRTWKRWMRKAHQDTPRNNTGSNTNGRHLATTDRKILELQSMANRFENNNNLWELPEGTAS